MDQREFNFLKGQCLNIAAQALPPDELRGDEKVQRELFVLAKALMRLGVVEGFADLNFESFGASAKDAKESACPKCGEPIHPTWTAHFRCGWKREPPEQQPLPEKDKPAGSEVITGKA